MTQEVNCIRPCMLLQATTSQRGQQDARKCLRLWMWGCTYLCVTTHPNHHLDMLTRPCLESLQRCYTQALAEVYIHSHPVEEMNNRIKGYPMSETWWAIFHLHFLSLVNRECECSAVKNGVRWTNQTFIKNNQLKICPLLNCNKRAEWWALIKDSLRELGFRTKIYRWDWTALKRVVVFGMVKVKRWLCFFTLLALYT